MAGSTRFELSMASTEELGFTGSYQNGQRGNYPNAILDRSGSFREGGESRMFSSGASTPRGSSLSGADVPPLTQCLLLDPIPIRDQKYNRLDEVRRALGLSLGGTNEDGSFGGAHSKLPSPMDLEELKRVKARVQDDSVEAKGMKKIMNESLLRLNKYCEALNWKKQKRNEMSTNERSGGSNFLKIGFQLPRNPSDLGTQKSEDRTKNIVLNKRIRSSMADIRVGNTHQRQSVALGKDRDVLRDGGEGSDIAEEKVRRLPAGGDGWDRKMKRKRSVGSVFARSTDNEVEAKRTMQQKFGVEPGVQSYDAQSFRSASLSGSSGINKSDGTLSPANSNSRAFPKNESDKISLSRDFAVSMNKERSLPKMNNKSNVAEDKNVVSPNLVSKGKPSRAPRSGSVLAANSSPNFSRTTGGLDGCEHSPSMNKTNIIGGQHNRKRPIPTGSSSPPMAQWVGQRPQKFSRTRRANVVSPVSNHDEAQLPTEGGQPSDFPVREASTAISLSHLPKDLANGTHQVKVKHEIVSSPVRLSESEESVAAENRKGTGSGSVEEKCLNPNIGLVLIPKKNKVLNKEDIGDGVRRQGRTARMVTSSRACISPTREKLETPPTKPLKNSRPVSDKNGSKSGRPPLKKISDRKGATRLGQTPATNSPDITGESDDDREELLAAANSAFNFSYLLCSASFWKKVEPVFSPISLDDVSYLRQQLNSTEEHDGLAEISSHCNSDMGDFVNEEHFHSHHGLIESNRSWKENHRVSQFLGDLADQGQDDGTSYGSYGRNVNAPLYQRVLSALIVEDDYEEFEENGGGNIFPAHYSRDRSPLLGSLPVEFDYGCTPGFQSQYHSSADGFLSNGITTNGRASGLHNQEYEDALFHGGNGCMPSKTGTYAKFSADDAAVHANAAGLSPVGCPYEQIGLEDKLLMELQNIGLYPETVPDLADGENEAINQDIIELEKKLSQQIGKKKVQLNKLTKAAEDSRAQEGGTLEQVAMDRLVELAYKKQLATRGSSAAKLGVPKVSKHVALAFMKRTLSRCRNFEDTGKSCFSEPTLRDVLFSAPHRGNDAESAPCIGLADTTMPPGTLNSHHDPGSSGPFPVTEQHDLGADGVGRSASDAQGTFNQLHDRDFAKTGPIWNRGKKKEVLLDDVGGNRAMSSLGNTLPGGAKGKRSERDKSTLGRNSVTKVGRVPLSNVKGDRKTKSKAKQKASQQSSPEDGANNKFKEANSNKKRQMGMSSNGYNPQDTSKDGREMDVADLQELDIELGVTNQFGGHQDLSSWLDVDGLPENEADLDLSLDGLEIPMDDLTELNVYL